MAKQILAWSKSANQFYREIGEIIEGQLRFPLVLRLPEHYRSSPEVLAALLIVTPTGDQVPLSRLAEVRLTEGPAKVEREWGQRRVIVSCNVQGRDVAVSWRRRERE